MTMFVGALSIDMKRIRQGRADMLCCFWKVKEPAKRREEFFHPNFQKSFVPLLFTNCSKIAIMGISILLITLGVMAQFKLQLGMNQKILLIEDSDPYSYYGTYYDYSETGQPAFAVFRDIDYGNNENLITMNQIASEMANMKDNVMSPVYSWIGPFQNYIKPGMLWDAACGSTEVSVMGFDQQMTRFV